MDAITTLRSLGDTNKLVHHLLIIRCRQVRSHPLQVILLVDNTHHINSSNNLLLRGKEIIINRTDVVVPTAKYSRKVLTVIGGNNSAIFILIN